ncbi:uncharacterized protein LOC116164973 isoform X2 [Photinus pyralis]|uniref:uncharacterized protein LOC116164973 isoform X2 n=1 Tax=Photinus pyralis TaxID=7054 RepID=UPI00126749A8|nr:uncharacterized protein LOC116164973 isoform X2 [Photinus pyralis]
MDSFCELPRSAPKPSTIGKVPIIASAPIVPEVSMIFPNRSKTTDSTADSVYLSYKAWKDHNKKDNSQVGNNKGCSQNSQRKQLRFDNISLERTPEMSAQPTNRPEPTHFTQNKNIPFNQIYMANIPNKQLELSILDSNPSHMKNIENIDPNIPAADMPTRHYLNVEKVVTESKSNKAKQDQFSTAYDSWFSKERLPRFRGTNESGITEKNRVVDLYNQKTDPTISSDPVSGFSHNAISTRDNVGGCNCQRDNNDQTIKDLLKIIQQLNEQIIILQKQVTTLLNNQVPSNPRQTVPTDNYNIFNEDYKTNLQSDQHHHGFLPKKPGLQQISLDVMTSFEVSIRRPPNSNKMCNNLPYPPKICEINETECNSSNGNILDGIPKPNDTDLSFSLSEPQLQVRENCPTPVNSIRVDMKDYSSDEEDEIANPAWTFYNNIMAQVNHILKKSGIQPTNIPPCEVELDSNDVRKQKMMRKVKQATIKHLNSIGVHIPSTEATDEFDEPSMCNQNDVSFAVKQLLMKYLPNDQLTRVAHNKQGYQNVKQSANIKRRPEFSIATVQYMQKYNLLNEKPEAVSAPIHILEPKPHFDRILDVTAIKKQPKLL